MGEFAASSRLIKPKSINHDVVVGVNSFIRKVSTDVCESPPVKLFPFFSFFLNSPQKAGDKTEGGLVLRVADLVFACVIYEL